ncbi:nucleotidyltransferase family protein [Arthrobacter sp. JSM 101049]|uniref:nucleotidyltransferase family protein n=1 Tax=Arthrobacter sp. JSM 101049 TaxID=929097 RepID=UPI0035633BD3
MGTITVESAAVRKAIAIHRLALDEVLRRYRARNPRIFGSAARGDATDSSDVDILVDLDPDSGNQLLRVAGIGEEFSRILQISVDAVSSDLLRDVVSSTALTQAIDL